MALLPHPCECHDRGCPTHPGHFCEAGGSVRVYRIDVEDETGTYMCDECATDAIDSGVFADDEMLTGPETQAG